MNYFAHGRLHLDRPYFVAGTAVPDWLNVVDRRIRARSAAARKYVDSGPRELQELAAGVIRHHRDDRWFHQTRAFAELNLQLTGEVRQRLPGDEGFRTGFLGHVLVEVLLDDVLIRRDPAQLDRYYRAIEEVDPPRVAQWVSQISGKNAELLAPLIPRFCSERFLADYADDARLLMRMNHVMRRVNLPQLPDEVLEIFPSARRLVEARTDELITPPEGAAAD